MSQDGDANSKHNPQELWATIAEREARLLALVEASAQIVWVTDERGFVQMIPPETVAHLTWSSFTGYPQQEMGGHDWIRAVHPDDAPIVSRQVASVIRDGKPFEFDFRLHHRSGEWRWVTARGIPVRTDGVIRGWIGTCTDISKLKATEESLRQAQKMQALGTMAGGIAHDFNNLLLAISGNVRLALNELPNDHPARGSLEEATKAGDRATDLVRRILTFAAKAPQTSTRTPICEAVQDAASLVRVSIPPNIVLRTRLCNSREFVDVSETELQQVIVNLITNAVHAIGSKAGSIEVTVDVRGQKTRISVQDNGCGMDAATIERVFDPFFTTKGNGKGTGLGLSVVHGIVTSVNGTISVDSTVGQGTTFFIELPLSAAQSEAPIAAIDDAPRGAGQRILYVDDDDAIVMLIDKMLTGLGYSVKGFDDSRAAAQFIQAEPNEFDIVVTDLSMPQVGGFDIARIVKSVRPSVPIIVTSGYVRDQDRDQAAQLGIGHLILKPNTIDELGKVLDALCKKL